MHLKKVHLFFFERNGMAIGSLFGNRQIITLTVELTERDVLSSMTMEVLIKQ